MLNSVNLSLSATKPNPLAVIKEAASTSLTGGSSPLPTQAQTASLLAGLESMAAQDPRLQAFCGIARRILQQQPFAPKNINLFTPQAYSDASPSQPAPAKPVNETKLKSDIVSTLTKRLNAKAAKEGLALYNDSNIKSIIPDPRLRTSLALLKGTAGEGGIDAIKNGVYSKVEFGRPPVGDQAIAEVVPDPATGKLKIIVNDKYQYEDPKLLATVLAHETLHQDANVNSNKEELIANAVEASVYGQVALEDPSLVKSGTELARRKNTQLLALLNSRDEDGKIRLLEGQGEIYPGGSLHFNNFGQIFMPLGNDTPGNPALLSALRKITGQPLASANFDDATLGTLDQNINLFKPWQWVRLANIMKLDITP